jgi:hypothetical protein
LAISFGQFLGRYLDVTVTGGKANQLSAEYAMARAIRLHVTLHAAVALPTILATILVPDTG